MRGSSLFLVDVMKPEHSLTSGGEEWFEILGRRVAEKLNV